MGERRDIDALHEAAAKVRERAYAPYSHFLVGAALETSDGEVFVGCNVENASYGLRICAERTAVFTAVATGHKRFERIVIVTEEASPPCGACLQVLREFGSELRIELATPERVEVVTSIAELLPRAYAPED